MTSKTSGVFVAISAGVLGAILVAYFLLIHEWLWTHHAFICGAGPSPADAANASWCGEPPRPQAPCNPYDGMCSASGNDRISETFALAFQWLWSLVQPWFYGTFAPAWNGFFDDAERRVIVTGLVGTVYGGAWLKVAAMAIDRANDEVVARRGQ